MKAHVEDGTQWSTTTAVESPIKCVKSKGLNTTKSQSVEESTGLETSNRRPYGNRRNSG